MIASPSSNVPTVASPRTPRSSSFDSLARIVGKYAVAILVVGTALLAKLLMQPYIGEERPFLLFFAAVMVAGWYGGWRAGFFATLLSMLTSSYFFVQPLHSILPNSPGKTLQLAIFAVEASMVTLAINALHAAQQRHRESSRRLRESESLYRLNVDEIKDHAIILLDADGRITSWNTGAESIFGFKSGEIIGQLPTLLFTPEDVGNGVPEKELARARAEGRADNIRWQRRRDGTLFYANGSVTAIHDERGNLRGFSNVLRDDTARKNIEEALRDALRQLDFHVQNSPLGVIEWDSEFRVARWSGAAERVFGWTPDEVIGRRFEDWRFMHEEDVAKVHDSNSRLLAHDAHQEVSHNRNYTKDGRVLHCEWYNSALLDRDGKLVSVLSLVLDTTERDEARTRLVASEERYRAFVSQSSEGIWRLETHEELDTSLPIEEQIKRIFAHGYLAEGNDAIARMYGYERADEITGAPLSVIMKPSDGGNGNHIEAFIRSGYRLTNAESFETTKDGEERYFSKTLVGIVENGFLRRAWGTQRDITERKRAEEKQRESEQRLRLALEAGGLGSWELHLTTGVLDSSDSCKANLGLPPDANLTYEVLFEMIHTEDRARVRAAVAHALETRTDYEAEYRIITADGDLRWILARGRGVEYNDGQPIRMLGVTLNITERKGVEGEHAALLEREQATRREAEAANRTKDEFMATLSHELRTPLTPIMGWVHLMRGGVLPTTDFDHGLGIIDKNAVALSNIINDLLDMSAIMSGKLHLKIAQLDLAALLREAVETSSVHAQTRNIRIGFTIPSDVQSLSVEGDRQRLLQIFWNLLNNAVKFSDDGASISVSCEADEREIRVHVEDRGTGIEPDFLPHIFGRFRQADQTTTRAYGGLGLGLALVESFTEAHGGSVTAESAGSGQGSRFTVRLPRASAVALRPVAAAAREVVVRANEMPSPAPEINAVSRRVLIVEDAPDTLEMLGTVFTRANFKVTLCQSAGEAIEAAEREEFACLVSDIGLPETSGYDLLRELHTRQRAQNRKMTPAIALTGYASKNDADAAHAAGFTCHIAKPVDPKTLVEAVEELLATNAN